MTVRLPSGLDAFTQGRRAVTVDGDDVAGVVAALEDELPGVTGHLLDGRGGLRPHVLCLADGTATRDLGTPVRAEVTFLTAVSGG